MFKRRNQRTWTESVVETVYPRTGWRRAFEYIGHRIKRLPDSAHKIAVGIACGVFVTFSPLFGLHFFLAAFLAFLLRGNILASLLATFVGNPVTFPLIAAISYRTGLVMMGRGTERQVGRKILDEFSAMFSVIWHNFKALFGGTPVPWAPVGHAFHEVFLPYLLGGLVSGAVFAALFYVGSKPMIAAYQKRRKGRLMEKFQELRAKRKRMKEGGKA
ncbi:MAG: DUF2062 domain-containing protein [Pseudomonadota bacterium]